MRPKVWPDGNAYVEAVQNAGNLGDPELRAGTYEVRPNGSGLPKPYSGGFTTTFHFTAGSGGYAVRCFTRGNDDLERRYQAITEFLHYVQNHAFCEALYLGQGIRVAGSWWPIIKMQWITGRQLNTEVETRLRDSEGLAALAESFRRAVGSLAVLGVAHGDLQHGNIIVANGELRLIDYDGIFLPALLGMQPSEFGHQNYQHPHRRDAAFDGRLDRFSSIVIYTALVAVSVDPSLWARFNNDENLMFRAADFTSDGSSELLRALLSHSATRTLAEGLIGACQSPIDQVPTLEQVIRGSATPVTGPAYSTSPPQPPPTRQTSSPPPPRQTTPPRPPSQPPPLPPTPSGRPQALPPEYASIQQPIQRRVRSRRLTIDRLVLVAVIIAVLGFLGKFALDAKIASDRAQHSANQHDAMHRANDLRRKRLAYKAHLQRAAYDAAHPDNNPESANAGHRARYIVADCGGVFDSKTGLTWKLGPDENTTWDKAEAWVLSLNQCDGSGWRMPTMSELATLYDPAYTSGTGFYRDGSRYPAHISPLFSPIGDGSWGWSDESLGDTARSFNFNQGVATRYDKASSLYTTRAFAVWLH